mgnify:CR=1 FL=1
MFMNKKKMVRIMVSIVTLYKYLYERMAEQIKTKSFLKLLFHNLKYKTFY